MIKLSHISKTYDQGGTYIVNDISLDILDGELLVILGSSGCGKTTTLKMINRLVDPTSGTIEIDGRDIMQMDPIKLRRSMGYAFQGVGLFPHMTVEENIVIALRLLGIPAAQRRMDAGRLMELVNLDPVLFSQRMPSELSGGQQQRVGVARALANNPHYLLMDEPFASLDAITRMSLQDELLRLHSELRKTIVFVTHDIFEAFRLADRMIIMHHGTIHQTGRKQEILDKPATEFVYELIQKPLLQFSKLTDSINR
ncbi:Glycine betaine/carnitine/choline transport ATP-binding protein OpuCA [Aquicella siphonis]|uniref:Glycine betaine/carnitine/choline transport ATP-binding protein OpuCA n=1 Tax=Aquicella siphonis TaxID=254247 RepID=A0A5E4PGW2_9COXI|nr:ATP-binding cassette domain-containing protein [Aquicella siphonis]VVC75596.1 Glycine betaine/carnitine/choline transport ATP-binding protein OpuCA [Aquicella siphonis]